MAVARASLVLAAACCLALTSCADTAGSNSKALASFLEWCAERGIRLHDGFQVRESRDELGTADASHEHSGSHDQASTQHTKGRGIFATQDVGRDVAVLSVPLRAVLTAEHAMIDPSSAPLWSELDQLSDLDVFAGFLAFEMDNERSEWKSYLDMMPQSSFSTLEMKEEYKETLKDTALFQLLQTRANDIELVREAIPLPLSLPLSSSLLSLFFTLFRHTRTLSLLRGTWTAV